MTEPVHQIGMTELYQELRSLGDKLSDYMGRQDVESNSLTHRVGELEKDLTEMKSKQEADAVRRSNVSFQIKMAFASSLIFPILVAVVVALLMKGS
jgi:hypothetical protein